MFTEYLSIISIYLLVINVITAIIFSGDKKKAKNNQQRVPEKTLHLLELAGGVFAVLFLMKFIRHKNRKSKYYIWTFLIFILWAAFFFFGMR